jgi:hypothetical protein
MATISIALCTYNGEQYLEQQLDSFVSQTRPPDELIVCDDRSSDSTVEIVKRFADRAPFPVRVSVNEENLGSSRNFSKAIELCTGDLILLADQDDVWLPRKLETIENAFRANADAGLVFSDAELVDEQLQPLGRKLSDLTFDSATRRDLAAGKAFESLLKQNFVTGSTAAFRSNLRKVIPPVPTGIPNLIHDAWIALSIARFAPVIFVDEPLIKYRQHGSQQIGLRLPGSEDRREHFESTIRYLTDDIERLRRSKVVFDEDQVLARKIDDLIDEKQDYIDHCRVRMDLPRARVARVARVINELLSGRYGRFSSGVRSAVRDIVER